MAEIHKLAIKTKRSSKSFQKSRPPIAPKLRNWICIGWFGRQRLSKYIINHFTANIRGTEKNPLHQLWNNEPHRWPPLSQIANPNRQRAWLQARARRQVDQLHPALVMLLKYTSIQYSSIFMRVAKTPPHQSEPEIVPFVAPSCVFVCVCVWWFRLVARNAYAYTILNTCYIAGIRPEKRTRRKHDFELRAAGDTPPPN